MKCSPKLIVACGIIGTVNALSPGISLVQRGLTVGDLTLVVGNATESVVDLGEALRRSAGDEVFDGIFAGFGAAFSKVADDLMLRCLAMLTTLRLAGKRRQC